MRTSLMVVALAGSACSVDMSEPEVTSTEQAVGTHNRLAANRLAANRLAANRLAANRLAANSLNELVALSGYGQDGPWREKADFYKEEAELALQRALATIGEEFDSDGSDQTSVAEQQQTPEQVSGGWTLERA